MALAGFYQARKTYGVDPDAVGIDFKYYVASIRFNSQALGLEQGGRRQEVAQIGQCTAQTASRGPIVKLTP